MLLQLQALSLTRGRRIHSASWNCELRWGYNSSMREPSFYVSNAPALQCVGYAFRIPVGQVCMDGGAKQLETDPARIHPTQSTLIPTKLRSPLWQMAMAHRCGPHVMDNAGLPTGSPKPPSKTLLFQHASRQKTPTSARVVPSPSSQSAKQKPRTVSVLAERCQLLLQDAPGCAARQRQASSAAVPSSTSRQRRRLEHHQAPTS